MFTGIVEDTGQVVEFAAGAEAWRLRVLSARASHGVGATQVEKLIFNGAGYHNNVIQRLALEAE